MNTFYDEFIASSDEIKIKFQNTDMAEQKKMLTKSLNFMFDLFARKEISDFLEGIAKSHSRSDKNIDPMLYDAWMECLLNSLKKHDEAFNDNVELAWRLVMAPGIAFMKYHYSR